MKKIKLSVKQKEFLKELEGLLLKYNAKIYWDICADNDKSSDTYGFIYRSIVVEMIGQKNNIEFRNIINLYDINEMLKGDDKNGNNNI